MSGTIGQALAVHRKAADEPNAWANYFLAALGSYADHAADPDLDEAIISAIAIADSCAATEAAS